MTGVAMARQVELSDAAQAWLAVEAYRISLTPIFDGELWAASADTLGEKHNAKRGIRSYAASAGNSLDAVRELVRKLEEEEK